MRVMIIASGELSAVGADEAESMNISVDASASHPLTAKLKKLALITLVVDDDHEVHVREDFGEGEGVATGLLKDVSAFVRAIGGSYFHVDWFGDGVDLIRKVCWRECCRADMLLNGLVEPRLVRATKHFELDSLLVQSAKPKISKNWAISRLVDPKQPTVQAYGESVDRLQGSATLEDYRAANAFYHLMFAKAGEIPWCVVSNAKSKAKVSDKPAVAKAEPAADKAEPVVVEAESEPVKKPARKKAKSKIDPMAILRQNPTRRKKTKTGK